MELGNVLGSEDSWLRRIKTSRTNQISHIKFVCVRDDKKEEIVAYNNIANIIKTDNSWDRKWKYKAILKHHWPLKKGNDNYKGSMYNLLIEWEEDQTIIWEPLSIFVVDDPASVVADYATNKHNLWKKDGWRQGPTSSRRALNQYTNQFSVLECCVTTTWYKTTHIHCWTKLLQMLGNGHCW